MSQIPLAARTPLRPVAPLLALALLLLAGYTKGSVHEGRGAIETKLNLETGTELMQHAVRWVEGERAG